MRRLAAILTVLIGFAGFPAFAQNAPGGTPLPVRGTVERLAGHDLTVKMHDGSVVTVSLADNFTVSGVARRSLADIKPGDYLASTSVKGTDGQLHAIEIHIFPPSMWAAVPEGQRPSSLVSGGLMTNAHVVGVAEAAQGQMLKVAYKDGSADVVVGPDAPIVIYVPGDPTLLRAGAAVTIFAVKHPDGSVTAARVTAEKDGVKPPM